MSIEQILENRGRLVEQMRALSVANPDGFDSETQVKYEKLDKEQNECKARVDRMAHEAALAAEMTAPVAPSAPRTPAEESYSASVLNYLRSGKISNALSVGVDTDGGFLTHEEFDMVFRAKRDHYNPIRPLAEVIQTAGDRNIRIEDDNGVSTLIDENAAYGESNPTYLNKVLGAYKIGRIVKVSEELAQDSDFAIDAHLAGKFGRSNGLAEEGFFIAGTGSSQPQGITTGATVVAPVDATLTAVNLLEAQHGLPVPYRGSSTWILNDDDLKAIRQIEDGNGVFVWQPGLQLGEPDRVLGRPYVNSAYQPAGTVTLGDLKCFTIVDRTGFSLKRLDELYAANGQVGYKGYGRIDSAVTMSEGIIKLTPA